MTAVLNEKPYTVDDIEALPEGQRAELIDGDMYLLATPTRIHQRLSGQLHHAILSHIEQKEMPCDAYAAPFAVYIGGAEDNYNYVEPDISVICDETKLTDKGCVGAPDWIIEIVSPSSTQTDYIRKHFDLTPAGIARVLKLKEPIYEETARYGHVGRTNEVVTKTFIDENGKTFSRDVELFTWEKLDLVDKIKNDLPSAV